jgi:RNA-directed DNA polymerase
VEFRALIELLFNKFPIHIAATAYKKGLKKPLLKNVSIHAKHPFIVKLDFKDYFPSIEPSALFDAIKNYNFMPTLSQECLDFVKNVCFVRYPNGKFGLGIGAPSSPIISNIIMYSLDSQIDKIASSITSDSAYTRYADDIVFSTTLKYGCFRFVELLSSLLSTTQIPKLILNESKTSFYSRGDSRLVTGLRITPDGKVVIPRSRKRFIRGLTHKSENRQITEEKTKYLRGYISFILDVEPDFYNRLAIKYGTEILSKLMQI